MSPLRLRPRDAYTLASRGFVYLKLGRYDAAIADYEAESATNPGNPYSLFGRGVAKRMTGNAPAGNSDIAAATALNANISEVMAKVGVRP